MLLYCCYTVGIVCSYSAGIVCRYSVVIVYSYSVLVKIQCTHEHTCVELLEAKMKKQAFDMLRRRC